MNNIFTAIAVFIISITFFPFSNFNFTEGNFIQNSNTKLETSKSNNVSNPGTRTATAFVNTTNGMQFQIQF